MIFAIHLDGNNKLPPSYNSSDYESKGCYSCKLLELPKGEIGKIINYIINKC